MKHYLVAACLLLTACGTSAPVSTTPRDVIVTASASGTARVVFLHGATISEYTLTSDVRQERISVPGGTYVRIALVGASASTGVSCGIRVDTVKVSEKFGSGTTEVACDVMIE